MLKYGRKCRDIPEYRHWLAMRQRCLDPKDPSHYQILGVRICPEWVASFEAFLRDVGPRPSKEHSLDRWPDPAGNYEPGNVRWATAKEQRHNWRARPKPFDDPELIPEFMIRQARNRNRTNHRFAERDVCRLTNI